MAPRLPKTIESKILDSLNDTIINGVSFSPFQLQGLVSKANTVTLPEQYALLAMLYSHGLKYDLAYENSIKYIENSCNGLPSIDHVISSLTNIKLFNKVSKLSKQYPEILGSPVSCHHIYESALYLLDIEYCEFIISNYDVREDKLPLSSKHILEFFCNDKKLVSRASAYFIYAFDCLTDVLADFSILGNFVSIKLFDVDNYSSLQLMVNIKGHSFEKVFDMECQWHKKIAQYNIIDEKLCDIAFSMEIND